MISETLQDAINEQINKEYYSKYYYLSMAAYLSSINLPGFENFFLIQVEEENFHIMKFFKYLNSRGGRVILKGIESPPNDFNSPLEVFELAYKHEQFVTKLINNLMDLALKEKDHAFASFLKWYIDEQVEEEETMSNYVEKLKLIGDQSSGIFMIDNELGARTFTPPESLK